MNLTKKKKKGFTLIELMAVIAIIAILAAVLVPTVTGYINRAKKTAIVTQVRNVVSAVETYNATAEPSKLIATNVTVAPATGEITDETKKVSELVNIVGDDLLSKENIDKLNDMRIGTAIQINKDQNAVATIKIDTDGTYKSYTAPVEK